MTPATISQSCLRRNGTIILSGARATAAKRATDSCTWPFTTLGPRGGATCTLR